MPSWASVVNAAATSAVFASCRASQERVEKASDMVSVGDEIVVKCLGLDKKGRLNFSRKEALPKKKKIEKEPTEEEPSTTEE